jgi:hypothetical protein
MMQPSTILKTTQTSTNLRKLETRLGPLRIPPPSFWLSILKADYHIQEERLNSMSTNSAPAYDPENYTNVDESESPTASMLHEGQVFQNEERTSYDLMSTSTHSNNIWTPSEDSNASFGVTLDAFEPVEANDDKFYQVGDIFYSKNLRWANGYGETNGIAQSTASIKGPIFNQVDANINNFRDSDHLSYSNPIHGANEYEETN